MRVSAVVPAVAAVCLLASVARAQDKQTCNTAYQDAQVARDAHKLIKAREQLRVCASATCPGFITKDCTEWLKDLEPRVPSVVFTAKNAAGADVTDVKVSMDGAPLADKLDGIAVEVDPGSHTFGFEGADGKTEQKVLVPEGTKAQRIAVTFGAAGAPAAVVISPGTPTATPATAAATSGSGGGVFPAEPIDHGLSFSFRLGYGIAAGSLNSGTSLSSDVSGQIPFWFDAGYLFSPYFYLGAYLSYGIGTGLPAACGLAGVNCSASSLRVGVDIQYRFLGKNRLQPWIGLGFLGFESGSASAAAIGEGSGSASYTGLEFVNPQVGFDYKFLSTLSAGPFLGVSIGEYLGASGTDVTGIGPKAIHLWIFLGARVNFDLHI
jgi:hypothetical protein